MPWKVYSAYRLAEADPKNSPLAPTHLRRLHLPQPLREARERGLLARQLGLQVRVVALPEAQLHAQGRHLGARLLTVLVLLLGVLGDMLVVLGVLGVLEVVLGVKVVGRGAVGVLVEADGVDGRERHTGQVWAAVREGGEEGAGLAGARGQKRAEEVHGAGREAACRGRGSAPGVFASAHQ